MAHFIGMCDKCKFSSKAFSSPFDGGWCEKYNKPIGKVKFDNAECFVNKNHIGIYDAINEERE